MPNYRVRELAILDYDFVADDEDHAYDLWTHTSESPDPSEWRTQEIKVTNLDTDEDFYY